MDRKTYMHSENPDLLKFKKRDRVQVHEWGELTFENWNAFQEIYCAINKRYPMANVWAFGSRINGNFTDESDYDIFVDQQIPRVEFKVKVDIKVVKSKPNQKVYEL